MNIFYLHPEPVVAATMQHDKHVVKMILETTQILSTVHARYGHNVGYKPTHANHPSTRWAGDSVAHYQWLFRHAQGLCREYTHRYGRTHACEAVLRALERPPTGLHTAGWVQPPQCMPDEFKVDGDSVAAYRKYYLGAKVVQSNWTRRARPDFVTLGVSNMATAKKTAPTSKTVAAAKTAPAKAAAPAAKTAPAKKAAPVVVEQVEEAAAVPRSRGPRGTTEDAVITLLTEVNPKREGSKAHAVFSYYEDGMTIGAFADALAEADLGKEATPNLVYDSKMGYISIEGYEPPGGVTVKEVKVKAEKPTKEAKAPKKGKTKEQAAEQAEADAAAEEEVVD